MGYFGYGWPKNYTAFIKHKHNLEDNKTKKEENLTESGSHKPQQKTDEHQSDHSKKYPDSGMSQSSETSHENSGNNINNDTPQSFSTSDLPAVSISKDPTGKYIATISPSTLYIWSASQHRVLLGQETVLKSSSFFVVLNNDVPTKRVDTQSKKSPIALADQSDVGTLVAVVWSSNGKQVAIATQKGFIKIWNVEELKSPSFVSALTSWNPLNYSTVDTTPSPMKISASENSSILEFNMTSSPKNFTLLDPPKIKALDLQDIVFKRITEMQNESITCLTDSINGFLVGTSATYLMFVSWEGDVRWRVNLPCMLRQDDALFKLGVITKMSTTQNIPPPIRQILDGEKDKTADCDIGGIVAIAYDPHLHYCGVVLGNGCAFLIVIRGSRKPNVVDGKWLLSDNALSIALEKQRTLATVGLKDGTIDLYYVGVPVGDRCPVVRKLSLSPWYFAPSLVGGAVVLQWSDDGSVLAVGWKNMGLVVWSSSGVRLMWTLTKNSGFMNNDKDSKPSPLDNGCQALCWSSHGFDLWVSSRVPIDPNHIGKVQASHFLEFPFVKSCALNNPCQSENTRLCMLGTDRILVLSKRGRNFFEYQWQEFLAPHEYLWRNWPLKYVSASLDMKSLAVAGANGIAIYYLRSEKWTLFGDLSLSRKIRCCGLTWFRKYLLVGNVLQEGNVEESKAQYELLIYSRENIDNSAFQMLVKLPSKPILFDVRIDGYLIILCENSLIFMYRLSESGGKLTITQLYALYLPTREHKNVPRGVDKNVMVMPSPGGGISNARIFPPYDQALYDHTGQSVNEVDITNVKLPIPTKIMLLRKSGSLILLDIQRMVSVPLLRYVEHFWFTVSNESPFHNINHKPLWWAYGDNGLSVCFPDSMRIFISPNGGIPVEYGHERIHNNAIEIERWLDVDPEIYPLGITEYSGMVIGVTQGLRSFNGMKGTTFPFLDVTVKSQPILHTLLRHMFQSPMVSDKDVLALAWKCSSQPQFVNSLEWLLHESVLDHDKVEVKSDTNQVTNLNICARVIKLLRYFGEYEDIVVRCARKMESKKWPLLFSLTGEPAALLEQCYSTGRLRTAACLLIILQEMFGFLASTPHCLRLFEKSLDHGEISLSVELANFLQKADAADMLSASQIQVSEDLSWIPKEKSRVPAVDYLIARHVKKLFFAMEFRQMAAISVRLNFSLIEWLKMERNDKPYLMEYDAVLSSLHRQFHWPGPRDRMDEAVQQYEEALKNPVGSKMDGDNLSSILNMSSFGITLPPVAFSTEPDFLTGTRLKARSLCTQELTYLKNICELANCPDLQLCFSTLLLDIQDILKFLTKHLNLAESYILSLKAIKVGGYLRFANYIEQSLKNSH